MMTTLTAWTSHYDPDYFLIGYKRPNSPGFRILCGLFTDDFHDLVGLNVKTAVAAARPQPVPISIRATIGDT